MSGPREATTTTWGSTATQAEYSDVLLFASVAVAAMNRPSATATGKVTVKLASPRPSVVASLKPRRTSPSPWAEGSQELLEKNSRRKVALGVLLSVRESYLEGPQMEPGAGGGAARRRSDAEEQSSRWCLRLLQALPTRTEW